MSKKTVYEIITDRIIKKLEEGTVPWQKPWVGGPAVNWVTQKAYQGINQILLEGGEWLTFNQAKAAGGRVKKGAKSEIITFWKMREVKEEDPKTGEEIIKKFPMLRYYNVFNINDVEGIKTKRKSESRNHDPIEEAEKIKEGYSDCPTITFRPGKALYRPSDDIISLPETSDFYKIEEFYSTLFHEMVHSTGHAKRLRRSGVTAIASFGSQTYSKEELVAEIGSAMLCGMAGIEITTLDNQAAYIKSWLGKLKDDPKLIITASSQAQKAVDYILGI